jgi:hypothetical protein
MSKGWRQISHDAFGRVSLYRKQVDDGECDECGKDARRFQYAYVRDDSLSGEKVPNGKFCSKSCFSARGYHLQK